METVVNLRTGNVHYRDPLRPTRTLCYLPVYFTHQWALSDRRGTTCATCRQELWTKVKRKEFAYGVVGQCLSQRE